MNYRILTVSDIEDFIHLRAEGLQFSPEAFGESYNEFKKRTLNDYKSAFPQSENNFIVGAFENGKLVGVVGYYQKNAEKMKHKGSIWGMYVTPNNRGKGIGRRLLEYAIEKAKLFEDILQIELAVISTNESARKLYESIGFESFGTEKRALFVNGQFYDEEHMVLVIK